jgi:hypothetical protein
MGPRGQRRPGGACLGPGCATQARLSLKAPMLSIFIFWRSSWPKNAYIKTPLGVPERRRWRNTKHRNGGCLKIGGGNAIGVTPGLFSNLSDINTIDTAMKREYSTSRLWVCGSSLFCPSLMLQCLDSIWAAQHDYGTYYVIPMWWILILLDDLWDVICYYVLDVWVDAYYYPVIYYLFWSNMYARAREGDGMF